MYKILKILKVKNSHKENFKVVGQKLTKGTEKRTDFSAIGGGKASARGSYTHTEWK